MSPSPDAESTLFDRAADEVVELGNQLAAASPEDDPWELASGLLAGAVHYWLYTRQPCGDPQCETCAEVATAELRIARLLSEVQQSAEESVYYHTPQDDNVGNA